ncbi:MAG: OsmC family peroxiredoxin [Actinomycetota bacterium]
MATRTATTRWEGDLQQGTGHVELRSSGAASFDVTFPRRIGEPEGTTSPEELIAGALSSCLAMNFSGVLGKNGLAAEFVDVQADVTVERVEGGLSISSADVTLRAKVDGVDEARFTELAELAHSTCPVKKALAGTTSTLRAELVA